MSLKSETFPIKSCSTSSISLQTSDGNTMKKTEIYFIEKVVDRNGRVTQNRYQKGKLLGKGGFASCYEVKDMQTGRILACKLISKASLTKPKHRQKLISEIEIHRSLSHPNIVQFERQFEDNKYVYILLELCNNQSLLEFVKKKKRLPESEARFYIQQILSAIDYMHDRKVIHRDLKLGNIFLNDTQVKIGDFGLATQLKSEEERRRTICGTPNYLAPEVLEGDHSFEVDIWAVGVILFTLLVGTPPFETKDVESTYKRIKENCYYFPSDIRISEQAKDLIQRLLAPNPESRPSVTAVPKHSWFSLSLSHSPPISRKISPQRSPLLETTNLKRLPEDNSTEQKQKILCTRNEEKSIPTHIFDFPIKSENGTVPTSSTQTERNEFRVPQKVMPRANSFREVFNESAKPTNPSMNPAVENNMYKMHASIKSEVPPSFNANEPKHQFNLNFRPKSEVVTQPPLTTSSNLQKKSSIKTLSRNLTESFIQIDTENEGNPPNLSKLVLPSKECQLPNIPQHSLACKVVKWLDLSDRYGLAYQLSDSTIGAHFNDLSVLLWIPHKKVLEYYPIAGKSPKQSFSLDSYPEQHKKKVTLIKYFSTRLVEIQDSTKLNPEISRQIESSVYVMKWAKTNDGSAVFRFNDERVQVFFEDKTKIILSSEALIITFVNSKNEESIHLLNTIMQDPSYKEIRSRLRYTKDILNCITSGKHAPQQQT